MVNFVKRKQVSIMTNLDIYNSIVETWYLEAKQGDKKLFYFVDEVKSLESGKKSYVIGRKGMGKTAISEYLYNSKNLSIYTERLSDLQCYCQNDVSK